MKKSNELELMKKIEHYYAIIDRLPDRNISNRFCPEASSQMRKALAARGEPRA